MYDEVIDSNNLVAISPKNNPVRWLFSVYCISTASVINNVYEAFELEVENLIIYLIKNLNFCPILRTAISPRRIGNVV